MWFIRCRLAVIFLLGAGIAARAANPAAPSQKPAAATAQWSTLEVELPTGETSFPPSPGAELAPQCLICHSAGMVLLQPPLTQAEWTAEINKMRNVFGAPLPEDQVETLAAYLYGIDGRETPPR